MIGKILVAGLMTLLLLCAGMGLLVVVYLWLVWYVSTHERRSVAEEKVAKLQGLSEADLRRLPTLECPMTEGGDGGGGGDGGAAAVAGAECVVCLELLKSGERCRLIPTCGHSFHVQCADTWLSKRAVCPICRRSAYEDLNNNNNNDNSCSNVENAVALKEGEATVHALDGNMIVI